MKIRITGIGNKARDYYTSRVFDLVDPLGMDLAVNSWIKHIDKYDKLDIIDAETGEAPIGDPFEKLAYFYAHVKG